MTESLDYIKCPLCKCRCDTIEVHAIRQLIGKQRCRVCRWVFDLAEGETPPPLTKPILSTFWRFETKAAALARSSPARSNPKPSPNPEPAVKEPAVKRRPGRPKKSLPTP